MKGYLQVLLAAAALTGTAYSQPQFTASHCFQVGDSAKVGYVNVIQNFADFVPQTGANHTWDFSATGSPGPWTTWTTPTTPYQFQPASASTSTSFPTSQVNEYAVLSFSRDLFYTYSAAQDTLYLDGMRVPTTYRYTPRIPYLSFPLDFSDSVRTWTPQFAVPSQPTNQTGSVTRWWKYDGYGTVIFPYGTATNVYRVHTQQVDSNYIINMATPYEELIWFRQSDGIPVLRFLNNGGFIAAYYVDESGATSLSAAADAATVRVHPNPGQGRFEVSVEGQRVVSAEVRDLQGRRVWQRDGQVHAIDLGHALAGVYLLRLQLGNGQVHHERLVLQH